MKNEKGYTLVELLVAIGAGLTLLAFIFLLIIGVKACSSLNTQIEKEGLKGVVTEIWEGNEKGGN